MERLAAAFQEFDATLRSFGVPAPVAYRVGDLRADTNWPWGYATGLYCFVSGGEVVYVGRAIGATLGSRLWSHLTSLDDADWAAVATDDDTQVLTYTFSPTDTHLVAALELFLIRVLQPRFNRHYG